MSDRLQAFAAILSGEAPGAPPGGGFSLQCCRVADQPRGRMGRRAAAT
jgi:hypothetical protein